MPNSAERNKDQPYGRAPKSHPVRGGEGKVEDQGQTICSAALRSYSFGLMNIETSWTEGHAETGRHGRRVFEQR